MIKRYNYSHCKRRYGRVVLLLLSIFVNFSCTDQGANNREELSANNLDTQNTQVDEMLINQSKVIIQQYKLTSISIDCLSLSITDDFFEGNRIVDIREKHSYPCKGDPDTQPRLFSLIFDRGSDKVWTDANSPVGQMALLNKTD
ncbi:hypothetical protein [Aliikangiella maris]|uniref:Uncharacterized protein n=2 Tax=Aliikangiella maris TaxID=3162458 RepID=A0ABV3MSC3_9GAMM